MPTLGEMMREGAMNARYQAYSGGANWGGMVGSLAGVLGDFFMKNAEMRESTRRFEEGLAVEKWRLGLDKF